MLYVACVTRTLYVVRCLCYQGRDDPQCPGRAGDMLRNAQDAADAVWVSATAWEQLYSSDQVTLKNTHRNVATSLGAL